MEIKPLATVPAVKKLKKDKRENPRPGQQHARNSPTRDEGRKDTRIDAIV